MKTLIIFSLVWIFADLASPPPSHPVVRSISGTTDNPEARKDFEKGLLLLHNFEYPDAAEMFREARKKDPGFAMAYWGEAMTYNHPVWLSQDTEKARKVMQDYAALPDRSSHPLTDLDRDLMKSLDLLYGDGDKRARDKAYAGFMETVYNKQPGNHDVAAFYALALLGEAGGWNERLCNRAAQVAGAILKDNPKHPGALHYFIHAEDHPEFAKFAWSQANEYAKVASYSGHALHMPSHIYLALGLWDDVVASNEVSWQAGVDRKEAKKLTNDAFNYHAHWWLAYGYLQQGRYARAKEVVERQLEFTRAVPSTVARNHFVIMRGHYLMESGNWQDPLTGEEVKIQDLRIEIRNLDRFVKGLKAYRERDKETLAKMVKEIESDVDNAMKVSIMDEGVTQCGSSRRFPKAGLNQAGILLHELRAVQADLQQDFAAAATHFRKAVALETENGYFYGPPEILKPSYEFYAEFLLSRGRYAEALTNFEYALERAPGRNQSLVGMMDAAAGKRDAEKQKYAAGILKKNLAHAEDVDVQGFLAVP